jgi:hypothetical protein
MKKKMLFTRTILSESTSKNDNVNLIKYFYLKPILKIVSVMDEQSYFLKECKSNY